ncbi:GGDEF domain-containing protein [Pelomonas sp. SE-A7]|uniref:GGDEF domain-containing protein n=1 Tax=Pelomonas sp. SE-A7 TaxID=3054953 RepID=UPI00259D0484|nr:GGDEF domain-containing protein [Pelomonas sp. SE-A7]MDM4767938.1 GGDEF domain-containing protein [Pelomonas sp. SE-A7]
MSLHIPTLLLALLGGYLLLGLQLLVARRGALRQPELGLWAWGNWAFVLGFAMLGARVVLPLWISVLVGNSFIFAGLLLYVRALQRFVECGWPVAPFWIAWMLSSSLTGLLLDSTLAWRTAWLSVAYALLLSPGIYVVMRHGWRREATLRAVGLTLALAATALCLRGWHALQVPEQYTDLMQASLGQGLTFLCSFLALMGTGFGFVLASFERAAARMESLASHDGLTGCLNRSSTDALLAHTLERGRREGSPVAFAMLDLDHFKQINDRYGHQAGDLALQLFAREVRQRLRASDVLGRLGGEEFGLLLPTTDEPGALRLLEQVRQSVAALQIKLPDGREFSMTVSAGLVVAASDSNLDAGRVYTQADKALYQAKHGGRNRVERVSPLPLPQAAD